MIIWDVKQWVRSTSQTDDQKTLSSVQDTDGTWDNAGQLSLGEEVSDTISRPAGDIEDWYRFSVNTSEGKLRIRLKNTADQHPLTLVLYSPSKQRLKSTVIGQGTEGIIDWQISEVSDFVLRVGGTQRETVATYQVEVAHVSPPDLLPTVRILRPRRGELFKSNAIDVELEADDDRGLSRVTVNGFDAIPEPGGRWVATVADLTDGQNILHAVVVDTRGQEADSTVEVQVDRPRKLALLVGVNEYQHFPDLNLPYSAEDAKKIAQRLKKHGFEVPEQWILTGREATSGNVTGRIGEIASNTATVDGSSNDTVLIYFSSHGVNDSRFYLATYDTKVATDGFRTDNRLLPITALAGEKLQAELEKINAAKLIVVFDSCHSELAMEWRPLRSQSSSMQLSNAVVIFSSRDTQLSWQSTELQSGIFTHFLAQVLEDDFDQLSPERVKQFKQQAITPLPSRQQNETSVKAFSLDIWYETVDPLGKPIRQASGGRIRSRAQVNIVAKTNIDAYVYAFTLDPTHEIYPFFATPVGDTIQLKAGIPKRVEGAVFGTTGTHRFYAIAHTEPFNYEDIRLAVEAEIALLRSQQHQMAWRPQKTRNIPLFEEARTKSAPFVQGSLWFEHISND